MEGPASEILPQPKYFVFPSSDFHQSAYCEGGRFRPSSNCAETTCGNGFDAGKALAQDPADPGPSVTTRLPKVLQVVLSLNPGGTEKLVLELVKRLQGEVPMAVCCLDQDGAWSDTLRNADIDVTALHRGAGFRPGLGRAIAQFAARHGATVLHCHQYSPFVYGSLARMWRPGLRVVFTEHGRLSDAPPSPKRRVANRFLSRAPRRVFTVSAELKQHLVAEGFSDDRVGVIYNGVDVGPMPSPELRRAWRRELNIPDGTVAIGTIARLDTVKDFGTMIRSVAGAAQRAPVQLLIIGDGAERQALEREAQACGAPGLIRFLGHRDDARQLLAACDVYANSSISEGISLTILEAMAAGLPIVATAVGGTPEIIDASCARLVPPRDPAVMSAAFELLAVDLDLRTSLGTAARRRVEERFTLDRMVREYRDVYYRVA